jgi:hypothetical protein
MRISEITDAQGQLELLRTIIDNTWTAIAQQAEQELRAEEERKAKAKLKPRSSKPTKAPYASPVPPLKKLQPLTANEPSPNPTLPNPNADDTIKSVRSAVKPMSSLDPSYTQAMPQKALNVSKYGYLDKDIDAEENDVRGIDRHSKNGIATHRKPATTF